MYESFRHVQQAVGLLHYNKKTHLRNAGAKRAEAFGVTESKLARLGRWKSNEEGMEVSQVMLKHYLNNVPIDACIGLAGFHVGRQEYSCNRGRICKIDCIQSIKQDADITLLVDYLAPNLLHFTEKCEIAYLRRGEVPAGERLPSSAQNYGFTRYCLAATVAWIQDAGLLLERKPNLANIPPYKWILDPDKDGIEDAFIRITKRVKDVVCLVYICI